MSIQAQQTPVAIIYDKAVLLPATESPAPPQPIARTDAEQAQAVSKVFSQQEKESEQVQGLLGMWVSIGMLHDLALETFSPSAGQLEEEEERERKKRENERVS